MRLHVGNAQVQVSACITWVGLNSLFLILDGFWVMLLFLTH